jgi:hypothetical protein
LNYYICFFFAKRIAVNPFYFKNMQNIIASYNYPGSIIPPDCIRVFSQGVNLLEKEFDAKIECEIKFVPQENKSELRLNNSVEQDWYRNITTKDIITYKLNTHFRICLEQFAHSLDAN